MRNCVLVYATVYCNFYQILLKNSTLEFGSDSAEMKLYFDLRCEVNIDIKAIVKNDSTKD